MKYLKSYNESLRDKMTPKSSEEILDTIKNYALEVIYLKRYNLYEIDNEYEVFEVISKLFNKPTNKLYLVNDEKMSYYFNSLIKNEKPIKIKDPDNDYGNGYWDCYVDGGFAHWVSESGYEMNRWIYDSNKIISNMNESLRDKMTGKSAEEIFKVVDPDITYQGSQGSSVVSIHPVRYRYTTTYTTLRKLFGIPIDNHWGKIHYTWNVDGSDGSRLSIWDFDAPFSPYELKRKSFQWTFQGENIQDIKNLIYYIIKNTDPVTESLRDKMTPVPNEEIIKKFEKMSKEEIIKTIIFNNLGFDLLPRNEEGVCVFDGDLIMYNKENIERLPDNLTVIGDMNCGNCNLTSLPNKLRVFGSLNCTDNELNYLPDDLKVKDELDCRFCTLYELPEGLEVGANLDCSNNHLMSIPSSMKIGSYINCNWNEIGKLPYGLVVKDYFSCEHNHLFELPDDIIVMGDMFCRGNQLPYYTSKPEGVEGDFKFQD